MLVLLSSGARTSRTNGLEEHAEDRLDGQGILEYRDEPEEIHDTENGQAENRRLLNSVEHSPRLREDQEEWGRERDGA
jgi:hypothetical protein